MLTIKGERKLARKGERVVRRLLARVHAAQARRRREDRRVAQGRRVDADAAQAPRGAAASDQGRDQFVTKYGRRSGYLRVSRSRTRAATFGPVKPRCSAMILARAPSGRSVDADGEAVGADPRLPQIGAAGFDRDAQALRRQHRRRARRRPARAKTSRHGSETTRTRVPPLASSRAASTATPTSRAGGQEDDVGRAALFAQDARSRRAPRRRRACPRGGSATFCRDRMISVGPSVRCERRRPRRRALDGVGRTPHVHVAGSAAAPRRARPTGASARPRRGTPSRA